MDCLFTPIHHETADIYAFDKWVMECMKYHGLHVSSKLLDADAQDGGESLNLSLDDEWLLASSTMKQDIKEFNNDFNPCDDSLKQEVKEFKDEIKPYDEMKQEQLLDQEKFFKNEFKIEQMEKDRFFDEHLIRDFKNDIEPTNCETQTEVKPFNTELKADIKPLDAEIDLKPFKREIKDDSKPFKNEMTPFRTEHSDQWFLDSVSDLHEFSLKDEMKVGNDVRNRIEMRRIKRIPSKPTLNFYEWQRDSFLQKTSGLRKRRYDTLDGVTEKYSLTDAKVVLNRIPILDEVVQIIHNKKRRKD